LFSNPKHESELLENNVGKIDLVIINLYPFDSTGELAVVVDDDDDNDDDDPFLLQHSL